VLSALFVTAVAAAVPTSAAAKAGESPPQAQALELAAATGNARLAQVPDGQAVPATVQEPPTPAVPLASDGPVLRLTVEEAVRRAIENNPVLALIELGTLASAVAVQEARTAFVPVVTGSVGRVRDTFPPSTRFFDTKVETNDWFGTGSVRQRLPWWGGTWSIAMDASHTGTGSPISNFDPLLRQNVRLSFSQPLFKDRPIDPARQQVIVAKRSETVSDLQFREAVARTVAAVKLAYWNLKASRGGVELQERSVALVEDLARENRARAEAGQLPELEVIAAEAEVSRRRSQLLLAQRLAGDAEDRLKRLIVAPGDRDFWAARIDPVDEPQAVELPPDLGGALTATLEGRLDILRARQTVGDAEADIRYYRNQRLPDIRLEVSYSPTALGGTPAESGGIFPVPVEQDPLSASQTFRQLLRGDYPGWSVGFTVSHPLGKTYEGARLARARIERAQAEHRVTILEAGAIEEIRRAVRQITSTAERLKATHAGVELAEQRLQVEQSRLDAGLSTPFFVTQAQRDLVEAEVAVLNAALEYQSAIVAFETLQVAPALSEATEVGLRGTMVVPFPPSSPNGISRPGMPGLF